MRQVQRALRPSADAFALPRVHLRASHASPLQLFHLRPSASSADAFAFLRALSVLRGSSADTLMSPHSASAPPKMRSHSPLRRY